MNFKMTSYISIGVISIICQIIILREFYVVFAGNEISLGIILSNWLLLTGAGSLLSNYIIGSQRDSRLLFSISLIVPCILLPIEIIGIRYLRLISGIPSGELFSLLSIWFWTFIFLLPICLIAGAQFNIACEEYNKEGNKTLKSGSLIYMYETIGALTASLIFTFILISYFTPMIISFLLLALCFLLLFKLYSNKTFLILFLLTVVTIFSPLNSLINNSIDNIRWQNINKNYLLKESIESNYGNIAIIEYGDENYLFENTKSSGLIPDNYSIQKLSHITMCQAIDKPKVLLIGGGLNGYIKELLKYNPEKIDYIEIDPKIIHLTEKYLPDEDLKALKSKNVNIIIDDARHYINKTSNKYDVIINNLPDPYNANFNRFYTQEFLNRINDLLNSNGIYVFTLKSSADFLGEELLSLNSSIYQTAKKAFKKVQIIPGDEAIYITSKKEFTINPDQLALKYIQKNITSKYFYPEIFEDYVPTERTAFINKEISNNKNYKINTDLNPISYYLDLFIYNKYTQTSNKIFKAISQLKLSHLLFALLVTLFCFAGMEKAIKADLRHHLSIFCFGFTGISLNIIYMFSFQNIFGGLYTYIGLFIATFMAGMSTGIYCINKLKLDANTTSHYIKILSGSIAIISLLTPIIINYLSSLNSVFLYLLLNIICGSLIGAGFGVINTSFINADNKNKNGTIYSLDLIGSALGALLLSSILLPVLGLVKTCVFLAAMTGFLLIYLYKK